VAFDPTSLRECHELDLEETLETDWALPVQLVSPDGEIQPDPNDPDATLGGQVLFNRVETEFESGLMSTDVIIRKPVVTLRISSLTRVPQPGERWVVRIPMTPSRSAPLETFEAHRAPTGGDSIGFITLHCDDIVQSP
jgi:hypothetical protein